MNHNAVIKSVPLKYAVIFLVVQFIWTCLKLNKLPDSIGRGHDSYVRVFEAAEAFRLFVIIFLSMLFAAVHYSQRDARLEYAVLLTLFVVWAALNCAVIVMFIFSLSSMVSDLTGWVVFLSALNVIEPFATVFLYKWMVRKGKLKIEWDAMPKLHEFTDPIQKMVYAHLPKTPPQPQQPPAAAINV